MSARIRGRRLRGILGAVFVALVSGCSLLAPSDEEAMQGSHAAIDAGRDAAVGSTTPIDGAIAAPADAGAASDVGAPMTPDAGSSSRCSEAGVASCYFLTTKQGTQQEAKAACVAAGAHLVTIGSGKEQGLASATGHGSDRWIGLEATSNPSNDKGAFHWTTGEPTTGYASWRQGDPDDHEVCVVLSSEANDGWGDRPCNESHAGICEYEPR